MSPTDPEASRAFATDVVRQLRAAGYLALWAGGCVRDLLMGRGAKDFDVATSATPEQVRELFGKRRTLAVGQSFGVMIVLPPDKSAEPVEVATFRTEGAYHDGRRPSSVQYSTPEEDAQRRDFTINGMFYDPIAEKVFDYVGGEEDLRRRVLRAIGDPQARMTEDKLRMLRAVRFTATLEFSIDEKTLIAVRQMASQIQVVSAERIAQELRRTLSHRSRLRGFELLLETGLLAVILPEVSLESCSLIGNVLRNLEPQAGFELALAAILHQVPATECEPRSASGAAGSVWEIMRRWKLSSEEMTAVAWLVAHLDHWNDAPQQTPAQLKRILAHVRSMELRELVRAVRMAQCLPLVAINHVDEFASRHTAQEINPPELVNGRDLIERGLSPGPEFKRILDQIRDGQLNGEITTRDEALRLLSDRSGIVWP